MAQSEADWLDAVIAKACEPAPIAWQAVVYLDGKCISFVLNGQTSQAVVSYWPESGTADALLSALPDDGKALWAQVYDYQRGGNLGSTLAEARRRFTTHEDTAQGGE